MTEKKLLTIKTILTIKRLIRVIFIEPKDYLK